MDSPCVDNHFLINIGFDVIYRGRQHDLIARQGSQIATWLRIVLQHGLQRLGVQSLMENKPLEKCTSNCSNQIELKYKVLLFSFNSFHYTYLIQVFAKQEQNLFKLKNSHCTFSPYFYSAPRFFTDEIGACILHGKYYIITNY